LFGDGGATVPGGVALEELLRRRIKVFSDDDGGLGVVLGGLLLRSMHLSSAGDLVRFL